MSTNTGSSVTMISFDIAKDNYKEFIQQIRNWAKDPNRISHQRPVLPFPPRTLQQAEYTDLQLRAKDENNVDRTLLAKIRRHDLYIVGYKMDGAAANWLEFKWDNPKTKIIAGSSSLGFGENYSDLGELHTIQKVGYTTLKQAISKLAVTQDSNTRKYNLMVLAVMIPETARFQKLSDILAPKMQKKEDVKFELWMELLLHNWGDLSDMLLREDAFTIYFRLPRHKNGKPNDLTDKYKELKIQYSGDAASCIAILKGNYPTKPKLALVSAVNTTTAVSSIQGKGLPLVEVFSVRINGVSGEIYGTVETNDGLGTFHLYERQRDSSQSIQANDVTALTGPYRGTSMSQYLTMSLDLKKKGSSPSSDLEVSKGSFAWDICELLNNDYYEKRLTSVVNGKSGSATVYYTPFFDAVQANVEVVLINGAGKDPASVYGSLAGRYSNYDYSTEEQKKYYRSILFDKPSRDNVKVKPGSVIALLRSVVAVPTVGSLIIEANLSNYNSATSSDQIAAGSAEFPPLLDGRVSKEIKGRSGLIRVTVTWKGYISE